MTEKLSNESQSIQPPLFNLDNQLSIEKTPLSTPVDNSKVLPKKAKTPTYSDYTEEELIELFKPENYWDH